MTATPSPSGGGRSARLIFRHRDFRLFLLFRFAANTAYLMQTVAIGWQVYDITHDPTYLGLVGLTLFLPKILLSLAAGHVADRFDRRHVVLACLGMEAVAALLLFSFSRLGMDRVGPVYAILILYAVARTFLGPSLQSLLPSLVPKEDFPTAVAWSSSTFQVATMAGPAIGGLLYAFGPHVVYGTVGAATLFAMLGVAAITPRPVKRAPGGAAPTLDSVLAGVRFIRSKPIILGAISLDLFAVLFGGATALLPVYARDILAVGPWGLGLLRSAPAVGAALCGFWLAHRPLQRRAGRIMFGCVGGFGLATVVFGLSTNLFLSLAALCALGACDMVSVYVRQSLVQLGTPDAMRGRVSAVNMVFIGASNELGEFESGITAGWFGTVPAVVLGGLGTLLVVVIWCLRFTDLRRVNRLDQTQAAE